MSDGDAAQRPFPWRQLPPGVDPLRDPLGFVSWADSVSDPRVAGWPLMETPLPTLVLCALYICFVVFGMRWMRTRPAFGNLKPVMIAYNAIVIAINVYMAQEFILGALDAGYKLVCNSVDYGPTGLPIARVVYAFYLSKLLDFCDTAFMILRRKFDQVTFLHVYHHCSMFLIWWMAVKWAAGGDGISGPIMNCIVHIVMYTYYLAAALGIRIPGKQIITQIQLLQFFLLMWHSITTLYRDCNYPHWTLYAQIVFCTSLVVLFGNFYFRAYVRGERRGPRSLAAKASRAGGASHDGAAPLRNGETLEEPRGGRQQRAEEGVRRRNA